MALIKNLPKQYSQSEMEGGGVVIEPSAGSSLSKVALELIDIAKQNPKTAILLHFNDVKVPIKADSTSASVSKDYEEIGKRQREEFLASPEGQEYTKKQEQRNLEYKRQQAEARALLDELAGKSSFQFPADMPSITGCKDSMETDIRKQVSAGAQWLADNPGKDKAELKELMGKTDTNGHSGSSFGFLMGQLKHIEDKGFDQYVEAFKETAARRSR